MHKRTIFRILGLAILTLALSQGAQAFPLSHYASNSLLSTGKWVKISVPEDGVYEITPDELAQMGFNDINAVRVYGSGGHMIGETLDGGAPDDLVPVPTKVVGNKLCFYGLGPVSYELLNPRKPANRYYTRVMNTYAKAGCYFLTDDVGAVSRVAENTNHYQPTRHRSVSINRFHHEKEIMSLSRTGKDLLGEDMPQGKITIDYSMPGLVEGDTLLVKVAAAGVLKESVGYINATLNDVDRAPFRAMDAIIYIPASDEVYYNTKSPYALIVPTVHNEHGTIEVTIDASGGSVSTARLDYVLLTYNQHNDMAYSEHGQLRMCVPELTSYDAIDLAGADASTIVWDVSRATDPKEITLANDGGYSFSPSYESASSLFIAFNPNEELMKLSGWERVDNQNIHGAATPDMVVVTNKNLLPQAERLAQLHRDHDGMDVLVYTQEQVFNEFSSGTPDAMAYRLMNKMFYDRDRTKFRNMLLFGGGSYDNRNMLAERENAILTYQTDASNDEEISYVSDDFFALMDDNSGYNVASALMRIGVGRITSNSLEEARTDVDKIENYVLRPDYGPWRNSNFYSADADDQNDGMHPFQAEGISNLVSDELGTNMASTKAYVSQYPRANVPKVDAARQQAIDGHAAFINRMNEGQYFMTYVGHAGVTSFSKYAGLWTSIDAANINNPHLPIMTTACCNVARYDSDQRGIAEIMFHNPKGGVIATLTSTRAVYAEYNDDLNRAWCRAMFSFAQNGYMPTLGEVVMKAKQAFGTATNRNKMSFLLMGDPAIKVNYPKPYFQINSICGVEATEDAGITITPLQQVQVDAVVLKPDKSGIDETFNGDGYVTIYGEQRLQGPNTQRVGYNYQTINVYYPREVIAQVHGRVVNGHFTTTVTMPRYYTTNDSTASIKVYAHRDNSDEMVNGKYDYAILGSFDPEKAINDDVAPVIDAMYLDDADDFIANPVVKGDVVLYISASDDVSFNVQSGTPIGQMKLQLDGGVKNYSTVKNFAVYGDDSRQMSIAYPIEGLDVGHHTLDYTVFDIAGNSATRSIEFTVEEAALSAQAKVLEYPAVTEATFQLANQSFTGTPLCYVKVVDTVGNVVYSTTTDSMPFTWDLKDNNGERVSAGVYRFYISYEIGVSTGGTEAGTVVVIDPVNRAN